MPARIKPALPIFAAALLFLNLFAASPAAEIELPAAMDGYWLIEAVDGASLATYGFELRVSGEGAERKGDLTFLRSGMVAPLVAARAEGDVLELEWEYEFRRRQGAVYMAGKVAGDVWRGEYRMEAGKRRVRYGTFTGRRMPEGTAPPEALRTRDFAGVWIGHYGDQGEHFRVRFEISHGQNGLTGAALMADEGIRAKVLDVKVDGDNVDLSVGWDVPGQDANARAEFRGEWRRGKWSGEYSVFPDGGRQAAAGGSFVARRPPGHAVGRPGAHVIGALKPPSPNGALIGSWQGSYRSDGKEYGLRLELSVQDDRYAGTIFLPDDRMEAAVFFASDLEGVGLATGSIEILDSEGNPETLAVGVEGTVKGDAWQGKFVVNSTARQMEGTFNLVRK